MQLSLKQVFRFGVFGLSAALIDYLVLTAALALNLSTWVAKTSGYVAALIFTLSLVANFTFRKKASKSQRTCIAALYIATAAPNLAAFQIVHETGLGVEASFTAALAVSSSLNFMGLRAILR